MGNKKEKQERFASQVIYKKRKKSKQKRKKRAWFAKSLITIALLIILGILAVTIYIVTIVSDLPELPDQINNIESTIIYDREGNILYTIHGEENRKEVPLGDIPQHVIDATIAIEDDQFFTHMGFDIGGIIKGFMAEFLGIGKRRGGSTITQQYIKNTLLTDERTITRKIKELLLAIQLERTYTKNEILSRYLNTIPYGSNAYGIEMAARIYFDKHSKDLTLAEASVLASLPQAPSRYNPYGNGKEALMGFFDEEGNYVPGRKDIVLQRMEDLELISPEEHQKAFEESSQITFKRYREDITYPHFVLYVKELLENKFGKEAVETGGLQVYTTIDPRLQDRAEEVIAEKMKEYPEKYGANNAAALTIDTETGQILAMVGSADYFNEEIDGNVNVVFRKRLPGSAFKPMVYATAFARGYSPATVIYDLETDFGNDYIPQNYDGSFRGPVSARQALAQSLNIPAVKMAFLAGVDNVVNQAKKMGITDLIDGDQYGTSIGLGTGETTLYQMVSAYSVFSRGGKKIAFTPFLRIETANGKEIESNENRIPREKEVLAPEIAYTINHILSDKSARPPEWNAQLQIPDQINAAKTGTSNKRVKPGKETGAIKPLDNWTFGYTTKVVTGVWVGNNDSSPLNYNAAGLTTAGKIWHEIMLEAVSGQELEDFTRPEGIIWKQVSRRSGLLPSEYTPAEDIVAELFTNYNLPTETDQTFLSVQIDTVSKKLPTEFTPEEAIGTALVANFRSLNPTNPNWEEPVQKWANNFIKTYDTENIILTEIPTEFDDVHKENPQLPEIKIISPKEGENVIPGPLEIHVMIKAKNGTEKVEYFVDQDLKKTVTEFPYTGKIRIKRKREGKRYRIGATVTDSKLYTNSDIIYVNSSNNKDTEPPESKIIYPEEGAIFPSNTTITIQTDSKDNTSINKLDFYLDDRLLGTVRTPPYNYTIELPDEIAPHTLSVTARDMSNNLSRDEVNIRIEEPDARGGKTRFVFPKTGSNLSQNNNIDFFIQISSAEKRRASNIQVIAKNTSTNMEHTIYTVNDTKNTSENYSFSWTPPGSGDYEFIILSTDENELIINSTSINLNIE